MTRVSTTNALRIYSRDHPPGARLAPSDAQKSPRTSLWPLKTELIMKAQPTKGRSRLTASTEPHYLLAKTKQFSILQKI